MPHDLGRSHRASFRHAPADARRFRGNLPSSEPRRARGRRGPGGGDARYSHQDYPAPPAPRRARHTAGDARRGGARIGVGDASVRVPVPAGDSGVAVLARALNAVQQQREDDRRRLRDVAARAFRAQESERVRLAHELQEETAQTLSSLLFRLRAARQQADPAARDAALDSVRALLSETANAVRGLARLLLPPALNDAGLAAALHGYAAS